MGLYNFAEKIITMESKEITKEEILQIPKFMSAFSKEEYSQYPDTFVLDINKGKEMDVNIALDCLLTEHFKNKDISFCKQKVFYFFMIIYAINNNQNLSEIEKNTCYNNLITQFVNIFPQFKKKPEVLGLIDFLSQKFIDYCVHLLMVDNFENNFKSAFSYLIYLYVNAVLPLIII